MFRQKMYDILLDWKSRFQSRTAMLVEGALLRTNDLRAVDDVKRVIIDLYEEDMHKISPSGVLSMLFDAIPAQLAKKSSRYHVSSVLAGRRSQDILEQIAQLEDSRTVLIARHADDPSTGLSSSIDLGKFKLYLADTGLFVTLAFKDADFTDNIVYGKLLSDKLPVGLGMVYENVVAQELTAHGRRLFYHTWPKPGTTRNYEIDFIVPDGKKVSPVEVKSSNYRTHASLDAFCGKYSSRVGRRYLVYTKDLDRDGPSTASDLHVRVPIGRGTVCISSNRGGRLGLVPFVGLLDQEESPLWRSTAGNNATESWICASNTNTAPLTSYRIR